MFLNVAVNAMEGWLDQNANLEDVDIIEPNDPISDVIRNGMTEDDSGWSFEPSLEDKIKIYYDETADNDLSPLVDEGYAVGTVNGSNTAVAAPNFTYEPKYLAWNGQDGQDVLTESTQDVLRHEGLWMTAIIKRSAESVNLQIRKDNGEVFSHYHKMTNTRDCLGVGSNFGFERLFRQDVSEWPEILEDIKERYEVACQTVVMNSPGTTCPDDLRYDLDELEGHVGESNQNEAWDFD
jgi:hypothetical protein